MHLAVDASETSSWGGVKEGEHGLLGLFSTFPYRTAKQRIFLLSSRLQEFSLLSNLVKVQIRCIKSNVGALFDLTFVGSA